MTNQFEKPNISFEKHTGVKTEVKIISEKKINEGTYGEIYDTVVEIGDRKSKRFIVKKYVPNFFKIDPKRLAEHAFKNYSLAKKIGLKVFSTFRISEDRLSILMTDGFFDDTKICIGSNNDTDLTKLGQPLIQEIYNIDEFLTKFFEEASKAAEHEISFHNDDVFFFIFNKEEPRRMDFFLGDLECIKEEAGHKKALELKNTLFSRKIIYKFIESNVAPKKRREILDRARNFYDQRLNHITGNLFGKKG